MEGGDKSGQWREETSRVRREETSSLEGGDTKEGGDKSGLAGGDK